MTKTNSERKRNPKPYIDIMPFALGFLQDTYGIDEVPLVLISQYITDQLAQTKYEVVEKDGQQQAYVTIIISSRLMDYYSFQERWSIIKHELVHYAMFVMGKEYKDGEEGFEKELKRLNIPSTQDIELRGKVNIFTCNCNPRYEIEMHHMIKNLPKKKRLCPSCNGSMKWKGTYLITENGRELIKNPKK